ncbi:hypothetical protein HanXRQr2_Chr10g0465371 [Helianthus annuus]|uniref:Uncharacterized protein n=1 Tax=Helianthus annuus TaxID=4232 RepID=A0A251TTN2_HELAN|nr:hypothetical protein HanXRQr2_Chr10g0465371 [Helianthus annuus]
MNSNEYCICFSGTYSLDNIVVLRSDWPIWAVVASSPNNHAHSSAILDNTHQKPPPLVLSHGNTYMSPRFAQKKYRVTQCTLVALPTVPFILATAVWT